MSNYLEAQRGPLLGVTVDGFIEALSSMLPEADRALQGQTLSGSRGNRTLNLRVKSPPRPVLPTWAFACFAWSHLPFPYGSVFTRSTGF